MLSRSAIRPVALFTISLAMIAVVASIFGGRDTFRTQAATASATPPVKGAAISKEVADQIAAINREKESRNAAQQKIDSRLLYAIKNADGRASLEGLPAGQYTVTPAGRRYNFAPVTLNLSGDLTGIEITPQDPVPTLRE